MIDFSFLSRGLEGVEWIDALKPSPPTPVRSVGSDIPYFDPRAKERTALPYVEAVMIVGNCCSLIDSGGAFYVVSRDVEKYSLKKGDKILVVPNYRQKSIHSGCIRRISHD